MYTDRMCLGCMNDTNGEKICSVCGYDMSSKNQSFCLPVKFLLSERYVIGKAVSVNSEGITYIAWDNASDAAVYIKEYYPNGIAVRNPDKTVFVSEGKEFSFNEGLLNFIELNKKLIATELQSLIPVLTVFEDNGTVYAATPVISSVTLQTFLDRNGGILRWEQARPLFLPLIDTLKDLHEMGIVHGGISPETIMVGRDGKLRLAGVCIPSLRMASADSPAELYSGYAAIEQYGRTEHSLCAASDVYAISAVLFRVLIGTVPASADERLQNDSLSIPSRFADELPRQVLVAIANGMQTNMQNRTKNIDEFKNELVYGETQENLRRAANKRAAEQKVKQEKVNPPKKNGLKYALISAGITVAVFLIFGLVAYLLLPKNTNTSGGNNSVVDSIPDAPQLGDFDPDAVDPIVLHEVPDLSGKLYSELFEDDYFDNFKFVIKGKEYSDKYERGKICAQSVTPGERVEMETVIEVTISLGPKTIDYKSVVGLDESDAIISLLKQGFIYDNIKIVEKYYPAEKDGIIVEEEVAAGGEITTESAIILYKNFLNEGVNDDISSETQE